jgi:hypothetical protein
MLRDEKEPAVLHAYASELGGCAVSLWLTGSRVIHAVSRPGDGLVFSPVPGDGAPGGLDVAVAAEAHNPQAVVAADGTLLLFDSYGGPCAGCKLEASYATCSDVGGMCAPKMARPRGGWGTMTIHHASSAAGPWQCRNVSVDFPCYSQNLTPSPFVHPNGTLYVVMHCDAGGGVEQGDLVMVRADDWRGPYRRVNDRVWARAGLRPYPEDPFLFISPPRGGEGQGLEGGEAWHIVMHNGPVGIHLFSRDGLNFTLHQRTLDAEPQPPFVYGATVLQTDGSSFSAERRERPWLLFRRDGRPELLATSIKAPALWPREFSHVQPISPGDAAPPPQLQQA